jgi:hypothetical protein
MGRQAAQQAGIFTLPRFRAGVRSAYGTMIESQQQEI